MRIALSLLFLSTVAAAQDVVRLRNGKHLSGTVRIDETDPNGFRVVRWDTGGTVYVLWSQVPPFEKARLLRKSADTEEALEGVRILTANREVLGLLVTAAGAPITPVPAQREQLEATVRVKTAEGAAPVVVPRSAIESYETLRIRESDAYSPPEMVDRRLKVANDVAGLLAVAEFLQRRKVFEKLEEVKKRCAAAAATDPSRKEELDGLVAKLEGLRTEDLAEKKVVEIRKMAETGSFEEALAEAEKFVAQYGETDVGKKTGDLVAQLKRDEEQYLKNRTEHLAKYVPDAWRALRTSLLHEYGKSKYKLSDARDGVAKMDPEILDRLSKKFKSPPEDIAKAWERREGKKRTVDMGTGSWIYKGGQDGGMDYEDGGGGQNDDPVDDFTRRFGGKKKDGKKEEVGKPLDTSDKWWSSASQSQRQEWLETEHALTSSYVKKEKEDEKKCSRCQGKGTKKETRGGKSVDVVCSRCHNAKVDVVVTYY